MTYINLIWTLDILSRYYPRFHSHEIFLMGDDIVKWMNNELPEDSSTLVYLKSYFGSPTEALRIIWKEVQLMAGPHVNLN